MVKPILKAYYRDLFFEFLVHDDSQLHDAVIILPGFPSSNKYDSEMRFLFEKGYNVFFPRYKGTYQSKTKGGFLESNPVKDLKKFVKELKKGKAKSLWNLSNCKFSIRNIIILGGSFSGAIACGLAAVDRGVKLVVLFSPVWDFKRHNESGDEQDLDKLIPFVKRAYKNLYRIKFNSLSDEMCKFNECFPDFYLKKMKENKTRVIVLHDPKDKTVSIRHSLDIIEKYSNFKLIKHSKGHDWNCELIENKWKEISKFLKN